jgi:hypothetical protein
MLSRDSRRPCSFAHDLRMLQCAIAFEVIGDACCALRASMGNLDIPATEEPVPLNFKVTAAFRTEFKILAAQRGTHMVEALQEAFDLFRSGRTK